MPNLHLAIGVTILLSALVVAAWGVVLWLRNSQSVGFWYMLRFMQAAVVAQVAVGGLLMMMGREPADPMHVMYGILPLVISFAAEALRLGGARRELGEVEFAQLEAPVQQQVAVRIVRYETGVMAVGAALVFGLALRAAMTSGGL